MSKPKTSRFSMKALKKLLLEFVPVFLGVILALFFNNIKEGREERTKINGLLTNIQLGTDKNIENLNKQLIQIQKVIDTLNLYKDDSSLRIRDVVSKSKGIRYIQFDLAAWNVLKSSELLVEVDYNLTSQLYLLNESINGIETIKVDWKSYETEDKLELVSSLEDFTVAIKYRIQLCEEINRLLKNKK